MRHRIQLLYLPFLLFLAGCPLKLSSGGNDTNVATSDSLKGSPLTSICQTGKNEIYITSGSGKVLSSTDGITFRSADPGNYELEGSYCDQSVTDKTHVWFAGSGGTILYYEGMQIVSQSSHVTADLHAMFGTSSLNVFAVGAGGAVTHWDGSTWTPQATSVDQALFGVGGRSSEVLAVGAHKTLLRYIPPGTLWDNRSTDLPLALPETTQLNAIWVASNGEAFVVGDGGKILHRSASLVWTEQTSGVEDDLLAVGGTSPSAVLAVGRRGTAVIYNGVKWMNVPNNAGTGFDLFSVLARSTNATLVVGNNGADGTILGITSQGLEKLL